MNFEHVKVDTVGRVGVLTLNHPEVLNAVSPPMLQGLWSAMNYIDNPQHGFRALVLTGEGRAFCAGANLSGGASSKTFAPEDSDAGAMLETAYHPFLRRLRNLKMPLVTAVNGAAAGVGMSFAMMGDMIVAGKSAYFLQAFRRIGLVPDGGSTWLLPRLVGLARAKELSLLGEKLSADKALDWGLINRVYDDAALMPQALALAEELAAGPTVALSHIRNLYWQSPDNTYEEQLNAERQAQKLAGRADDFAEGVSAFQAKRKAEFKGR
ncbi:MAG: enoyl-CoA hydratase/isomerase [Alphaproteobacteria bacterium]|nr:enoyl-CoA hydratase/isomerase [Alphaproteobacteria bacterium]